MIDALAHARRGAVRVRCFDSWGGFVSSAAIKLAKVCHGATKHAMLTVSDVTVIKGVGPRGIRAAAAAPARPRAPARLVGPTFRGKAVTALQASRNASLPQASSTAWAEAPTPEAWRSAPDPRPLPSGAEASPRDDGQEYAAAPVPYDWRRNAVAEPLKELPPPPRGVADDVKLSNPLVRFPERITTRGARSGGPGAACRHDSVCHAGSCRSSAHRARDR